MLAATLLFVVLRLFGNPVFALISVGATEEDIARAAERLGVDRPIYEQFFDYVRQLVTLDLGQSFTNHLSVGDEIVRRLNVTLPLTLLSFALSVLIAVPVGFFAAWKSRTWFGSVFSASRPSSDLYARSASPSRAQQAIFHALDQPYGAFPYFR